MSATKPVQAGRYLVFSAAALSWVSTTCLAPPLAVPAEPIRKDPVRIEAGWGVISFVAISPNSRTLAYGQSPFRGESDAVIILLDLINGKEVRRLKLMDGYQPHAAAFSPDGNFLAVGHRNRGLFLLDLTTGNQLLWFERPAWAGEPFVYTADGKTLAGTVCNRRMGHLRIRDERLHLWDASTGKELGCLADRVKAFSFSRDGTSLITERHQPSPRAAPAQEGGGAYEITLELWDAFSGKHMGQVGQPTMVGAPDAHRPIPVGRKLREIGAHQATCRVRIAPEGEILIFPRCLAGSGFEAIQVDGDILISEICTGKECFRIQAKGGTLLDSFVLSPNCRTLVLVERRIGNPGSAVVLWDLSRLQEKRPTKDDELTILWNDLGERDVSKGHRAACKLASSPGETLAFVRKRVDPILTECEKERFDQLVGELDDNRFLTRERAEQELVGLGRSAVPTLRQVLQTRTAPEIRRRVERILEELEAQRHSISETLKSLWLIEVMEELGTAEARQLLARLGNAAHSDWVRQEVNRALERLAKEY